MYWISERDEQKNPQISEAGNRGMFGILFEKWQHLIIRAYISILILLSITPQISVALRGVFCCLRARYPETRNGAYWNIPLKKERSDSGKPSHRSFDMKLLSYLYVCMLFFLCWNLQPLKKTRTNKKVIEIKWQHILNAVGRRLP